MEFFSVEAVQSALGSFGFLLNLDFWRAFYVNLRSILIVLSVIFLVFSLWILIKIWPTRVRLYVLEGFRAYRAPKQTSTLIEEQKSTTRKKWAEIIQRVETGDEKTYSLAMIEADRLLEDILGRMGFGGKNIAERLRSVMPSDLPSVGDVWEAHKLRNRIAHETDFTPAKEETMRALGAYKKALEELKAI